MSDSSAIQKNAVLFHLDDHLASLLALSLAQAGCIVQPDTAGRPQIVFCAAEPGVLEQAMSKFPQVPVVVVSRLPETDDWLDALEAGAADYCAAPFEPVQLRWLLDTHMRPRQARAAA